jgi:hypothetical protein
VCDYGTAGFGELNFIGYEAHGIGKWDIKIKKYLDKP